MYILLSSAKRKRYKDDVLRVLAAPMGTDIQFRYALKLISPQVLKNTQAAIGKEALVCHVDLPKIEGICSLIPIRSVVIRKVNIHGTTASLTLEVKEFTFGETKKFTEEISTRSGNQSPKRTGNLDISGFFFFELQGNPETIRAESTLENWEKITGELYSLENFGKESYFWVVLSLREGGYSSLADLDQFKPWPVSIKSNKEQTVLIYVFHPRTDSWDFDSSRLFLQSFPQLTPLQSRSITVESPYDLKHWTFIVEPNSNSITTRKGWLRIWHQNPISLQSKQNIVEEKEFADEIHMPGDSAWELELPLNYQAKPWVSLFVFLGAAIVFVGPGILTITRQSDFDAQKDWPSLLALFLVSIATSIAVTLGTKKI